MEQYPEGAVFVSKETKTVNVTQLGAAGVGAIDPEKRVEAGEITDETIEALCQKIDEYFTSLASGQTLLPKWCVDGRGDKERAPLAPNASGGTYSLVAGDAFIDAAALLAHNQTSAAHAKTMFESLQSNGYEVGGHCDDHASGENAGCGACDKMEAIFRYIAQDIDSVSSIAATLGVIVTPDLQQKMVTNINNLLAAGYVSSGKAMVDIIRQVAGNEAVQTLRGSHKEVLLTVNSQPDTTLDRRAVASIYGPDYQVFNLDTWALKNGISAISNGETEAEEKFVGAILYNIGTAAVLAGPSLRIISR